jgi:hypothetical protein
MPTACGPVEPYGRAWGSNRDVAQLGLIRLLAKHGGAVTRTHTDTDTNIDTNIDTSTACEQGSKLLALQVWARTDAPATI